MATKTPKPETRSLDELLPFPKQAEFFEDLAEEAILGIAKGMAEGRVPLIEILPKNRAGIPPNTILRGHQRAKAARLNGTTKLTVLVRYDLIEADRATIEREFLVDNQHRRHQDPLARARVALRLYQLAQRDPERRISGQDEDARDVVGRTLNMSGRNLQRYWSILRAPLAVQEAFRTGGLKLTDASKIGSLPNHKQAAIAERLAAGEAPTEVLRDLLAIRQGTQIAPRVAIGALAAALERCATVLGDIELIRVADVARHETTLRDGNGVIEHLLSILDKRRDG